MGEWILVGRGASLMLLPALVSLATIRERELSATPFFGESIRQRPMMSKRFARSLQFSAPSALHHAVLPCCVGAERRRYSCYRPFSNGSRDRSMPLIVPLYGAG